VGGSLRRKKQHTAVPFTVAEEQEKEHQGRDSRGKPHPWARLMSREIGGKKGRKAMSTVPVGELAMRRHRVKIAACRPTSCRSSRPRNRNGDIRKEEKRVSLMKLPGRF